MPNWVNNYLDITGSPEAIAAFKEKAAQPYTTHYKEEEQVNQDCFSFWNFKRPPQEALDNGEYFATHGFSKEHGHTGQTPNNWYNWNSREWGTKWDACDPELTLEDTSNLHYSFNTAWSPPTEFFEAMVEQHPELEFFISCEEEQGWGVEFEGRNGTLIVTDEWDIPNSHADYKARDRECYCEFGDYGDRFDDCPFPDTNEAVQLLEEADAALK